MNYLEDAVLNLAEILLEEGVSDDCRWNVYHEICVALNSIDAGLNLIEVSEVDPELDECLRMYLE